MSKIRINGSIVCKCGLIHVEHVQFESWKFVRFFNLSGVVIEQFVRLFECGMCGAKVSLLVRKSGKTERSD